MKRVSFSGYNQNINDIINWFNIQKSAMYYYKNNIITNLSENHDLPKEFFGFSLKELEDYFKYLYEELENVTCLSLLSAVEANLRMDYLNRVYGKKKDKLSRKFREIYKEKGDRISLEEDILQTWVKNYPNFKTIISNYKSTLKYRNWLAHGRYWIAKLEREYDVDTIYSISDNIISNITNN